MTIKTFEVRDSATFIPVLAVSMEGANNDAERYLLRRCGFNDRQQVLSILVTPLAGGRKATVDAYDWNDRTMQNAHHYIEKHWDELRSGDVVDVEFILGYSSAPKRSERQESTL